MGNFGRGQVYSGAGETGGGVSRDHWHPHICFAQLQHLQGRWGPPHSLPLMAGILEENAEGMDGIDLCLAVQTAHEPLA